MARSPCRVWSFCLPLALVLAQPARAAPLRVGLGLEIERGQYESIAGWLSVSVPLERMASRSALAARPELERAPVGTEAGATLVPAPARPAAPGVAVSRFDSRLLRELVREALRLQGQSAAKERLDALAGRSRVSALLPELTLRAARSTDQTLRLAPAGTERYDLTQTGGADLLFEGRATWNLDRLVFADEELRVEQLRLARDEAGERLAVAVLKHFFAYQRARARLAAGELDPEAALALELEAFEAEAALDVLTGGLFGRRRASRD